MRFPIGYIIAFLCGIAALLFINFINEQKQSSVKGNSGLYPMVYKSIEEKQKSLNELSGNEQKITSFKKQLQYSQEVLTNLKLPSPSGLTEATTETLLTEAKNLRDELQKAYDATRVNYYQDSYNDLSAVEASISNISRDLNNHFSWTFDILWSSDLSSVRDSLIGTPVGPSYLTKLRLFLGDTSMLKRRIAQMNGIISTKVEQVDQLMSSLKTDREKVEAEMKGLDASLKDIEQASKDRMLMYVVIPLFGLIVVLLMVLPYIYKQSPEILGKLFEQKIILQIFTVFILVMAVLLLGIGDKIKAETLGTLLGGISVYVLQRSMDGDGRNSSTRSNE